MVTRLAEDHLRLTDGMVRWISSAPVVSLQQLTRQTQPPKIELQRSWGGTNKRINFSSFPSKLMRVIKDQPEQGFGHFLSVDNGAVGMLRLARF